MDEYRTYVPVRLYDREELPALSVHTNSTREWVLEKGINDFLEAQNRNFLELKISPDDTECLITFGSIGVPEEPFTSDILDRTVWKMSLIDGESSEILAQGEDAHGLEWSPDGREIAYISRKTGNPEIWIMNRDGSNQRQMTHSCTDAANPLDGCRLAWSPDGKHIAYAYLPNGSRYSLNHVLKKEQPRENIIVHKDRKQDHLAFMKNLSARFTAQMYALNVESGESRLLLDERKEDIHRIEWLSADTLLVCTGASLLKVFMESQAFHTVYSGHVGLIKYVDGELLMACMSRSSIEFGFIREGAFETIGKVDVPGCELQLQTWSSDASTLYVTSRLGVSSYVYSIDRNTFMVKPVTEAQKVVCSRDDMAGVAGFNQSNAVLFPYGSLTKPAELWHFQYDCGAIKQKSHFHCDAAYIPKTEIIEYHSEGWSIESILVYPRNYVQGKKYPALVFLHGGPEGCNLASYSEIASANGQSAALFLSYHGYAVLLPNFRGSSGYGQEFENQLGDYKLMRTPYTDVMAGVDHLVDAGIADPELLGVYGFSYGGGLTSWTVSQTARFKGAAAVCGIHDSLGEDRSYGTPFYAYKKNRLGSADRKDLWLRPEIYKELSALENVGSIKTPILLIETGDEREIYGARWSSWSKSLFNALCELNVETRLVCYTEAWHAGGWTEEYQRDYLNRLLAWFQHCIKGESLPEWF